MGLMVDGGGGQLVKKSSKSRQKVEESSKSPKNLKDLKSCKGHRFGGTFTRASILRQLDTRNSSFQLELCQFFQALFAGPKSSLNTTNDYRQGKASGAVDALLRFSREAKKIFKSKTLESFTSRNQQSLCTKVLICAAHVFPLLLRFGRCAPKEDVQV